MWISRRTLESFCPMMENEKRMKTLAEEEVKKANVL